MFALLYIVAVLLMAIVLVGLYQKNTNAMCTSKKRLDGKTTVVTGGTAGMGLKIATNFADRGARVIVACPFPEEGASAVKTIVDETGNEKVEYVHLDLASLASVRQFVDLISHSEQRLDILINNAGVGIAKDSLTKDGLHFIMQVNYYGHFLLTLLLLPLLRKTGTQSGPCRIVNTSSILHNIGGIDIQNLNRVGCWYGIQTYGNSKLALILFAQELTKRLEGAHVVVNTVDPGAVGTAIFNCLGSIPGAIVTLLFGKMYKTPWEGAQTAIHVALDERAGETKGGFFKNCKLTSANRRAYSERKAMRLWRHSIESVKLSEDELKLCLGSS